VFRILRTFVLAALGCSLLPPLGAQQQPPAGPAALAARAEKAIADYEAIPADRKNQAQKNRALLWLGEIDSDAVTDYLKKELDKAGDTPFAATVMQAIAQLPRPKLGNDLWQVLHREAAPVFVRNTAANTIVKLGDRGIDRLLAMLRGGDDVAKRAAREAAIAALVASKDERAFRGLAPLLDEGTSPERLEMLRRLENVQGVPPVSQARVRMISDGTVELAAAAWRQLAAEGHERARALAVDLFERLPDDPAPSIAADLIVGIALVRDADFYPVLLRLGASPTEVVRRALRTAAPLAAKDPELVKWLATRGLENDRPAARDAALLLLREAPKEAVQPLLAKVRAELRNPKRKSLDLAIGLHEVLARDPTWRTDLLTLAASPDNEVRTVGLALLLELGSDAAVVQAQQSLSAKPWELRAAALRYLTKFRDVSSIPLLIARFGKEDGRLGAELAHALFVHTGTRCWKKGEWDEWWVGKKVGFVLPHPDTVQGGKVGGGQATTVSYYDIPLVSSHVAFLIDHSGSMAARIGTDKKFTRLEAAKEQLTRVLSAVPDTHWCNLIAYESGVRSLWDKLRQPDDENRKDLLARVKSIPPGAGTNIFGALEMAFADPEVDTVYLLTDGEPSVGKLIAPDDILDEVRRWNRTRQIVIHCIGLGIDSQLLKNLAAESGGSYKYVQ